MKTFTIEDAKCAVLHGGHELTRIQIKILILRLIRILSYRDPEHDWHLSKEPKK